MSGAVWGRLALRPRGIDFPARDVYGVGVRRAQPLASTRRRRAPEPISAQDFSELESFDQ